MVQYGGGGGGHLAAFALLLGSWFLQAAGDKVPIPGGLAYQPVRDGGSVSCHL